MEKTQIFSSNFLQTNFYPEHKIVEFIWLPTTANLDEAGYRKQVMHQLQSVKDKKPTAMVIDGRDFNFLVVPELQQWVDQEISPQYIEAGVKEMAVVLPGEIFSQAAIEQLLEETSTSQIKTRYFETIDEALKALID